MQKLATKKSPTKLLRRYTNLSSLFDILQNQRITLLDPATWDDKNDSFFMEKYKEKKSLKTLLGLCFTEKNETYHHWKVFSSGSDGICIAFKREQLLNHASNINGVKFKEVSYKGISEIESNHPHITEMPFVKRLPYQDEKEFRIIYENMTSKELYKQIPIDISSIEKVNLSPWTPEPLIQPVRQAIKIICKVRVLKTSLLSNSKWQKIGSNIQNV